MAPYRSIAQMRWAHTKEGQKDLGGAGKVKEWDDASKGKTKSLPYHVAKHKKKK
jgi:hypothetical protein